MILAGGFLQSDVKQISAQTKVTEKKKSMPIEFYYENRAESLINNGIIMSRVEIQATQAGNMQVPYANCARQTPVWVAGVSKQSFGKV